jgi:hypothetical protein
MKAIRLPLAGYCRRYFQVAAFRDAEHNMPNMVGERAAALLARHTQIRQSGKSRHIGQQLASIVPN